MLCKTRESAFMEVVPLCEAERLKYRWIVLFSSFLVRFFAFGTVMSVGILYVEWLNDFQRGLGETALIGSLATGTTLLMGPISSALLDHYSCRQAVIASGVAMSIGLICSAFANGVPYLCASFGIVAGCSGGIANLASVVSLNQYFDKQRPLAMGIGSGGTGLGIFVIGLMQKYFVEMYTWRGSLLLLGAIQLHMVVCGLLMVHPSQLRHNKFLWNWRDSSPTNLVTLNQEENQEDQQRGSHSSNSPVVDRNLKNEDEHVEIISIANSGNTRNQSQNIRRRRSTFQKIRARIRLTQKTIDLWKNPTFLILFVSDFLSWLVQFVPYVHLGERASMLGIENGAILISLMGIASAFGKVAFGALCTFFKLSTFKVFVVAQTLFGISTVLSPLCTNFWSLCLFCISFGFLSGSYGLMMVIPARLLDEERFSLAYGFMLAGEGIGVYLGPPLVGWITDATQSYNSSFFLAGCLLICSALVLMLRPILMAVKRRNKKIRQKQAWTEENGVKRHKSNGELVSLVGWSKSGTGNLFLVHEWDWIFLLSRKSCTLL